MKKNVYPRNDEVPDDVGSFCRRNEAIYIKCLGCNRH